MIIGIGTDICDIRRIEELMGKFRSRFLEKTFTADEQAYCESKARPAMSYAKRFAAKEAVAKALKKEQINCALKVTHLIYMCHFQTIIPMRAHLRLPKPSQTLQSLHDKSS